jgi:hypothetical protein
MASRPVAGVMPVELWSLVFRSTSNATKIAAANACKAMRNGVLLDVSDLSIPGDASGRRAGAMLDLVSHRCSIRVVGPGPLLEELTRYHRRRIRRVVRLRVDQTELDRRGLVCASAFEEVTELDAESIYDRDVRRAVMCAYMIQCIRVRCQRDGPSIRAISETAPRLVTVELTMHALHPARVRDLAHLRSVRRTLKRIDVTGVQVLSPTCVDSLYMLLTSLDLLEAVHLRGVQGPWQPADRVSVPTMVTLCGPRVRETSLQLVSDRVSPAYTDLSRLARITEACGGAIPRVDSFSLSIGEAGERVTLSRRDGEGVLVCVDPGDETEVHGHGPGNNVLVQQLVLPGDDHVRLNAPCITVLMCCIAARAWLRRLDATLRIQSGFDDLALLVLALDACPGLRELRVDLAQGHLPVRVVLGVPTVHVTVAVGHASIDMRPVRGDITQRRVETLTIDCDGEFKAVFRRGGLSVIGADVRTWLDTAVLVQLLWRTDTSAPIELDVRDTVTALTISRDGCCKMVGAPWTSYIHPVMSLVSDPGVPRVSEIYFYPSFAQVQVSSPNHRYRAFLRVLDRITSNGSMRVSLTCRVTSLFDAGMLERTCVELSNLTCIWLSFDNPSELAPPGGERPRRACTERREGVDPPGSA